jgi:hypothetical protein
VKKRKKESEKEKERTMKPVLVSLFPALWLLSDPSAVGWQRCNNTSSLEQAPSSSTNTNRTTIVAKRNSKTQNQKKFVTFNIKQQRRVFL